MPDLNHYHCNDCDDAWTTGETAAECPVCESTDIHEVEFDEIARVAHPDHVKQPLDVDAEGAAVGLVGLEGRLVD